jgi:hypothetical protein
MALVVALTAAASNGGAAARRGERAMEESIESRPAGQPVMAIVSLQSQRITIYDAKGWIMRAPVSSGQSGRETPAGIFSVIEKDADHHSNLYDDASMPHMQRLTWSGIALHAGHLPGYPASHGCVRMPYDFAERLFDVTQMGLRVIVAPTDVTPAEIDHPLLFQAKPGAGALAAAKAAEADEAAKKVDEARRAAAAAYRDSNKATMAVRVAENLKRRAEEQLANAEAALGSALPDKAREQAESNKAQAIANIAKLQVQLDAAKVELQPKLDAVKAAREAIATAGAARVAAAEAARQVMRELEPVSVLISRKTQRLYVRQGFEPLLDAPVTIQDPDRPIGTHVFTAMEKTGADSKLRWNVVSLDGSHSHGRDAEPVVAEPATAQSALDRITIPQETLDRITGISPRTSLIVTDEGLSSETGKGTDFVVLLSGEPQGGIKMRRREPVADYYGYERPRRRRDSDEYSYAPPRAWRSSPYYGDPFSSW